MATENTKVTIHNRMWYPTYRDEPNEDFPEGKEHVFNYWDLNITFVGPLGTYQGGQIAYVKSNENATDDELIQAVKAAWNGTGTWEAA